MSNGEGNVTSDLVTFPSLKHVMSLEWRNHAACAKMPKSLFFDYNAVHLKFVTRREYKALATSTCNGCPVRKDCYEFAVLNNEPYGIWAGTVPEERKVLYKEYLKTGVFTPLAD